MDRMFRVKIPLGGGFEEIPLAGKIILREIVEIVVSTSLINMVNESLIINIMRETKLDDTFIGETLYFESFEDFMSFVEERITIGGKNCFYKKFPYLRG